MRMIQIYFLFKTGCAGTFQSLEAVVSHREYFQSLEIVARDREPQFQVPENGNP